jgi:hypothetical protein
MSINTFNLPDDYSGREPLPAPCVACGNAPMSDERNDGLCYLCGEHADEEAKHSHSVSRETEEE